MSKGFLVLSVKKSTTTLLKKAQVIKRRGDSLIVTQIFSMAQ